METWRQLNDATIDEARSLLQTSCGSARWVTGMLARRPFASEHALLAAARDEWLALSPADWLEAFSHHPKIGERSHFDATRHLSEREQSGVSAADQNMRAELAARNREYEEKFGFIFIVCATGKSAEEMLALLRTRLANDRETELRIAAEEQAKITALRLTSPR